MGRQASIRTKVESGKVEPSKRPVLPNWLGRFVWHPAALIVTALSISVSIASVATLEIIRVDPSPTPSSASASHDAQIAQSQLESSQIGSRDSLPLSSLGAVAISCAAGSFLLCRWFKPRKPDRRMQFSSSSKRTAHAAIARSNTDAMTRATQLAQELPSQNQAQVTAAATIVPANEAHPLDWNEPSIADNLDLRQKRPLSHWL